MPYQEETRTRPRRELVDEAIALANQGRWEEAVAVNRTILEGFPTDVDAHNRLGRALMELGRYAEARAAYARALELSPNNQIAKKNLERLSLIRQKEGTPVGQQTAVSPEFFVSESSKSRVVRLYHLASKRTLARVHAGDQVFLRPRGKHLQVETADKEVLGWVEPRYELRLLRLMKGGNKYDAAVVSVDGDSMKILITETYQHPKQAGKLSFPATAPTGLRSGKESLLRRDEEDIDEFEFAESEEAEEAESLPAGFTVMENGARIEEELNEKDGI
ncbi:MAG: tetratricopeptide repeat protein [Dehalococcoidia bacterium]|nr:tetratricopeptide repeat protein [Dehalococcoidia bacterium]